MWSTAVLLVLLSRSVITADENSDSDVQKFLNNVASSIASKNSTIISELFESEFYFMGCKGVYNKEKMIGILSHLPAETNISFILKSSEYVIHGQIRFAVEIIGFEKPSISEFFLTQSSQQLIGGSIPSCTKTRFVREDATRIVEKFLGKIITVIETKSVPALNEFFVPDFTFDGCNSTFDRKEFVEYLFGLPQNVHYYVYPKKIEDLGETIRFEVDIAGFHRKSMVAELVLVKSDQQLKSGTLESCETTKRVRRESMYSDREAQKFLNKLDDAISSNDAAVISGFFQSGFIYKGCKEEYNKQKIVEILSKPGYYLNMELKVSEFVRCREIKYTIYIHTPEKQQFHAEFIFNQDQQQLVSGSCTSNRDTRNTVPLERAIIQFAMTTARNRMCANDKVGLAALFDDKFTLEGCDETINKDTALAEIWKVINPKNPFEFYVHAADYEMDDVKARVKINGIADNEFEVMLLYSRETDLLRFGKFLTCSGK